MRRGKRRCLGSALPSSVRNVVVDEVQREPSLLDVIQPFLRTGQFRFVLTGSSARKLRRGMANLLGGRAVTRSLWPLVSWERPRHPGWEEESLAWGGLPMVALAGGGDEERKDLLRSYVSTYLAEEVVAEQLVRNLVPFRRFLGVAAQMSGKIINTSAIARDIGTSHNTVASYFEILEETLVGFGLPAWSASVRKRLRAKPKFYLFDTGLTRALCRTLEALPRPGTSVYGDLFEQMVLCEVQALKAYFKPDWELAYLCSEAGAEIDLVIDTGISAPILVEIKSTDDVTKLSPAGELRLLDDTPASRRLVLSRDPIPKMLANGIEALPWRRGLAEIFNLPQEA